MSEGPVIRGGGEIRQTSKEFCMPLSQTSQFYYGGIDSIAERLVVDRMIGAKVSKNDKAEALVRVTWGIQVAIESGCTDSQVTNYEVLVARSCPDDPSIRCGRLCIQNLIDTAKVREFVNNYNTSVTKQT